jgi:predicted DNA-binding transcriptional regulator AlpA
MPNLNLVNSSGARAKLANCSRMTIWRWVREGKIPPPMKINSRNYWRTAELDEAIKRLAEESETTS